MYQPFRRIEIETPTRDVFSLESLIAWLERQPGEQEYCYTSNGHCLLAQYLTAHGIENVSVSPYSYRSGLSGHLNLPYSFERVSVQFPRTFGAALVRARAARAAKPER